MPVSFDYDRVPTTEASSTTLCGTPLAVRFQVELFSVSKLVVFALDKSRSCWLRTLWLLSSAMKSVLWAQPAYGPNRSINAASTMLITFAYTIGSIYHLRGTAKCMSRASLSPSHVRGAASPRTISRLCHA